MTTAKEKKSVKQVVKNLANRWFITAFSGMAQGLFCTLIAGTILALIAKWIGVDNYVGRTINTIANFAKSLMGAGIGVGIAFSLKKSKLLTFASAVAGIVGAFADKLIVGQPAFTAISLGAPGNPIGSYVVTMLVVEICELYAGKTKLDIILIPLGVMLLSFVGIYVAYPFVWLINELGLFISIATDFAPFVMGIIISVIMGILLTMPTSSAAIWLAVVGTNVNDSGLLLAGGAAVVGCACHMVGFAVTSYRENGVSGLISQGLGTSMLQIPNIMKKPIIMLPEIIASAILGPVSTCLFKMNCTNAGGGMGTSGLVGVFGVIDSNPQMEVGILILAIALLLFILPAGISLAVSEFMRKKGYIKFGDMKLDN